MDCKEYCLNWPAPDLTCLPCLPPGIQPEQFCKLLKEADETIHQYTGYLYTGCDCWAELQICPQYCDCRNFCNCDPCFIEKADLGDYLCAPVWDVLEVKINGEAIPNSQDWRILENCDLVCPPNGWPAQYLRDGPNADCTWTVTVRYGTPPPARLLRLRDQYFFDLLRSCYPASLLSCSKEGISKITTKSGTYEFSNRGDVLEEVACHYGPTLAGFASFDDPGNPDKQYKILTIRKGSNWLGASSETCYDCEDMLLDWVAEKTQDIEPGDEEAPLQTIKLVEGKVYNRLGQPVG